MQRHVLKFDCLTVRRAKRRAVCFVYHVASCSVFHVLRSLSLPVQLRGGSVVMGLHRGEDSTLSRVEEVLVNDGDWHHLQLDISGSVATATHHKAVLSVDHGLYLVSRTFPHRWPVAVGHQFRSVQQRFL